MGNFTGGQLWTERKDGTISPPFDAKGMDPSVKGRTFVTKGKWHRFDGTEWHGVTPVKEYR
eukprot:12114846-Prorocentrum_lima.AAC.1